jgi:DNA-binding FrmR family transcriptional regulator
VIVAAYDMQKADIAKRLARIEGQVRGIARMVEEDRYCIDILDQVSAITKALQQVSLGLLHDHLEHCVVDAVHAGESQAQEKIDEATAAIARLMRS